MNEVVIQRSWLQKLFGVPGEKINIRESMGATFYWDWRDIGGQSSAFGMVGWQVNSIFNQLIVLYDELGFQLINYYPYRPPMQNVNF